MQQRILNHEKIQPLWNKTVMEFVGDSLLRAIRLKDTKTGEESMLEVAGAFEAIGHQPNTGFLEASSSSTRPVIFLPIPALP